MFSLRTSAMRRRALLQRPHDLVIDAANEQIRHYSISLARIQALDAIIDITYQRDGKVLLTALSCRHVSHAPPGIQILTRRRYSYQTL